MKKKILCLILAIFLAINTTPISVNAENTSITKNLTNKEAQIPEWWDWVSDVLWYVAQKGSQYYFTQEPITSITDQRVELTKGATVFNSGNVGPHAYIDLEAESSTSSVYLDITVKATTDFLNAFLDTIIVSLYIPAKQYTRPRGTACYSASNCTLAVNVYFLRFTHIPAIAFQAIRLGCHSA